MRIAINERFHFSEFVASDMQACLEHFQEREIYDSTLRLPYPYSPSDFDTWMGIVAKSTREQGEPVNWAIRDGGGQLVGGLGFDEFIVGKSHRAEIGYWLAKPYWGRGIMTAAVAAACRRAFDRWKLSKITAHVFVRNPASARVLEKCGFEQEGYLKQHFRKDGQLLDVRLYALIRTPT